MGFSDVGDAIDAYISFDILIGRAEKIHIKT